MTMVGQTSCKSGKKCVKSGPVSDAIGDKAAILQNHGEIKEQQSLTLTGTRCCFLCSGVFGCLARPDVSPLPLPSCCCVLCKSKVRPPGPAAHPLPPARPHSFGPLLTSQKREFSGRKFLPPGSVSILHIGRASIGYCAVWGPLSRRGFQTRAAGVGTSATFQKFRREFLRRRQSRIVNNCQQPLD